MTETTTFNPIFVDGSHAPIQPSSIERTSHCLASLVPLKKPALNEDTEYSREGTEFHDWMQRAEKEGGKVLGQIKNEEMFHHATNALQQVRDTTKAIGEKSIYKHVIEERVGFSNHTHGTLDRGWLYIRKGVKCIYILDYKYGKGKAVPAQNNLQLLTYAVAAMKHFNWPAKRATIAIYQPRNSDHTDKPLDQWTVSEKELKEWARVLKRLEPKALAVINGEVKPKAVAGDWCTFCRRRAGCPALTKRVSAEGLLAIDSIPPLPAVVTGRGKAKTFEPLKPEELTDEQISMVLQHADPMRKFLKSVEIYGASRCLSADPITGWKAVAGRSSRKWIDDEEQAANKLKEFGVLDPFKRKLIGITEAERLLKKDKAILKEITTYTTPKPKLVPESDPRPALENDSLEMLDTLIVEDEE